MSRSVGFKVNGTRVRFNGARAARLSDVLRDELGLTGTKIGCNAGDCGACTVLLDGRQVCACLTPVGQVEGRDVLTVEGLARNGKLSALQVSFQKHGAAQCGICTPGALMAAADLLARVRRPNAEQVKEALGGVLCRCTGYQKIIEAVVDAAGSPALPPAPAAERAVGARVPKIDGIAKLTGAERFGADAIPKQALWLRVVRSPHHRARFTLGDLDEVLRHAPGLARILSARDVPSNGFGIYPSVKDQPVLADGEARFRGEAVLALVGTREAVEGLDDAGLPIEYQPLPPVMGLDAAMAPGAAAGAAGEARQPAAGRRRAQRRCSGAVRALRSARRRQLRNRVRRARLHRARGRVGGTQGRSDRNPRHHPDALHGPRRSGRGDEART